MQLRLPKSETHPQLKVIVNHPNPAVAGETLMDDSFSTFDIDLPEGASADDLEVIAVFCDRHGKPDPDFKAVVLKERVAPLAPPVTPPAPVVEAPAPVVEAAPAAPAAKPTPTVKTPTAHGDKS